MASIVYEKLFLGTLLCILPLPSRGFNESGILISYVSHMQPTIMPLLQALRFGGALSSNLATLTLRGKPPLLCELFPKDHC